MREVNCGLVLALGGVIALGGCYSGTQAGAATDSDGASEGEDEPSGGSGDGGTDSGTDGDDPVPEDQCADAEDSHDLLVRRLTRFEYANTVQDVLAVDLREDVEALLPEDIRVDGFSNNVGAQVVTFGHIEAYHELALVAVTRIDDLTALSTEVAGCADLSASCQEAVVRDFGLKLWRRPLSDTEIDSFDRHFAAVQEEGEGFDAALGLVLRTMMASPQFLYRLEDEVTSDDGAPTRSLGSYEVASRLSYLIWGSAPDDALYQAAASDALLETANIEAQVERMLKTPRAREVSLQYIRDWLALDGLSDLNRDPELYPGFTLALAADMREETQRLFEHIIWEEQGSVVDILDADYTFASPELAAFYGIDSPEADWAMYDLTDLPNRQGIMTHAGVLALNGHGNRPSVVERGLFVLRSVLCSDVIAPPANVDTTMSDVDPDAPERVKSEARLANATCASCHAQFDPMGWGFERYDGVGAYKETDEFGNALADDGWFISRTSDGELPYQSLGELVDLVAADETAQLCVGVKRPLQFAVGRPLRGSDSCAIDDVAAAAADSGGSYQALITAIAVHPSFRRLRLE